MPTVCTVMAASSQIKASKDLYQCYRLFQVEESSPVAGGETPFHSFGNYTIYCTRYAV